MANQTIRISLKLMIICYWMSTEKIVKTANLPEQLFRALFPCQVKERLYNFRSPHVDKKSREQFQTKIHKRLVG